MPSLLTVEALEQRAATSPIPDAAGSSNLSKAEAGLLQECADNLINAEGCLPPSTHGVEHHIITEGRPATSKFVRLCSTKLAATKEEFRHLEQEGIIRCSNSDWVSRLHMVQKADRSWWLCSNYRCLDLLTEDNCYPLLNMADITSSLVGVTVFSKLDLKKDYHQTPVHPSHIKNTAIITPFGLFEFVRLPFRLKNTGMTFQCFIDKVLASLPLALVYLGDILVASQDRLPHADHLHCLLQRLKENGLVLYKLKCEFLRSEVEFLGLKMPAGGVAPIPKQLATVRDFPEPGTVKELQAFLEAVNLYHQFIPVAAKILLPLTAVLKGAKRDLTSWSGRLCRVGHSVLFRSVRTLHSFAF